MRSSQTLAFSKTLQNSCAHLTFEGLFLAVSSSLAWTPSPPAPPSRSRRQGRQLFPSPPTHAACRAPASTQAREPRRSVPASLASTTGSRGPRLRPRPPPRFHRQMDHTLLAARNPPSRLHPAAAPLRISSLTRHFSLACTGRRRFACSSLVSLLVKSIQGSHELVRTFPPTLCLRSTRTLAAARDQRRSSVLGTQNPMPAPAQRPQVPLRPSPRRTSTPARQKPAPAETRTSAPQAAQPRSSQLLSGTARAPHPPPAHQRRPFPRRAQKSSPPDSTTATRPRRAGDHCSAAPAASLRSSPTKTGSDRSRQQSLDPQPAARKSSAASRAPQRHRAGNQHPHVSGPGPRTRTANRSARPRTQIRS